MILKPNLIDRMGEILELATDYNFYVSNIKMCRLSYEDAKQIFKISEDQLPFVLLLFIMIETYKYICKN